jgi:hypothetical protein
MENKTRIKNLLTSTNDPRFEGTITSIKQFYSLSNDVFKVDFSDGRAFVVKIEDPTKINLLTFYKPKALSIMKDMEYGSEIFLYAGNHLEIESFIKSQGMTQKNFVDEVFRLNVMRNAAEFNTLGFDDGKENFWNIIREKKIVEGCVESMLGEIEKYKQRLGIDEALAEGFTWKNVDGLVGTVFHFFYIIIVYIFIYIVTLAIYFEFI